MFAIIKLAGKQHRVEKDQIFLSELVKDARDTGIECNDVLMVGEKSDVRVGKPFIKGAVVKLKILETIRGKKIRGFIYQKRKGTRRSWGHRQELLRLQVVEIKGPGHDEQP